MEAKGTAPGESAVTTGIVVLDQLLRRKLQ